MSSEFTFGGNSDKSSVLKIMNLVDRDLIEHQITQTLTLSRLHTQLEQTRGIRLFNHPLEQTGNPSVQCSASKSVERLHGMDPWRIQHG